MAQPALDPGTVNLIHRVRHTKRRRVYRRNSHRQFLVGITIGLAIMALARGMGWF